MGATASIPIVGTHPDVAAPQDEEAATDIDKPAAEEAVVIPPTTQATAKSLHTRVDSAIEVEKNDILSGATDGESLGKEALVDKLQPITEVKPILEGGSEVL
jgi:hypothetical protein